ncbi:MAG: DUF1127 domain-containing protein [Rhodospirillales bacterium]
MSKTFTTSAHQAPISASAHGAFDAFFSAVAGIATTALGWNRRAIDRARLRDLPDHLLKDMGISRLDAEFEAGKPFWKA